MTNECQPDWETIKADYADSGLSVASICKKHNISIYILNDARRRFGWPGRYRQRTTQRQKLIGRMFGVLEKQIEQIEGNEMNLTCDKEVALLGNLARTLEKLIELDAKQLLARKPDAAQNKDMQTLREKLTARINQLEQE